MRPTVRPRWLLSAVLAIVLAGVFAQSSYGITYCWDYVVWRLNGENGDADANDAVSLRRLLKDRHYVKVLTIRAKTGPGQPINPLPQDIELDIRAINSSGVAPKLAKGDVLIFGESHTGIVRDSSGRFDHFLQIPKWREQGKAYKPAKAATLENWFVGRDSWTLGRFFSLSREEGKVTSTGWTEWLGRVVFGEKAKLQYPFLHVTAEVWRPPPMSVTLESKGLFSCTKRYPNSGVSGDGLTCRGTIQLPSKEEVVLVKNGTQVTLTARVSGAIPPGWELKLGETGRILCEVPRRHPSATKSCTAVVAEKFPADFRKDRYWGVDLKLLEYAGLTGPGIGIYGSLHEVQIWWGCPFSGYIPQCP